jgi:hypothetical protein
MKPCALVALGLDGVLDLVHRVSINVGPARRVAPSGFGGVYVRGGPSRQTSGTAAMFHSAGGC